jgi:sec-independent protein translocase protein TatB
MFDIGWQELIIIGALVIIVVGPKDLPRVLKTIMGMVRKARGMAREFQSSVDDLIREADLDDMKHQVESAGRVDLNKRVEETLDPDGKLKESLDFEKDLGDDTWEEHLKEMDAQTGGSAGPKKDEPASAKAGDEAEAPDTSASPATGEAEEKGGSDRSAADNDDKKKTDG